MAYDPDKYPIETGRRRFVKGVVSSAALASLGTTAGAAITASTGPSGEGGGSQPYLGIERVAGPAPRGMPLIPVTIDSEGRLSGVWPPITQKTVRGETINEATMQIGGIEYSSEWFQYCGVQTYEGIAPEADQDNAFRYDAGSPYTWQDSVTPGEQMRVDDFTDYTSWGNNIGRSGLGKPAMGTWRSNDTTSTIPIQVLRVAPDIFETMQQTPRIAAWLKAAAPENFIAWLDKCTHFCCVPGFKTTPQSAAFGAEDKIYCPCHQSVYDPFSIREELFVALPRPVDS